MTAARVSCDGYMSRREHCYGQDDTCPLEMLGRGAEEYDDAVIVMDSRLLLIVLECGLVLVLPVCWV